MQGIGAQGQPGRKFFDQLVRGDWQGLEAPDYIPSPGWVLSGGRTGSCRDRTERRAGTVICQVLDTENVHSAFVRFDAFDLSRGPQATLHLKQPVHLGFHTAFKSD